MPELVNLATQTPGLSALVKVVAGIDRHRKLPKFAPLTLQQWFARRDGTTNPNGRRVVASTTSPWSAASRRYCPRCAMPSSSP